MSQLSPPNTGGTPIDTATVQLAEGEGARNIRLASTGNPDSKDDFAQIPGSWRLPEKDDKA